MKCLKPDYKNQTWGENARPLWICITALDPRPGRDGRVTQADCWDYDDDQISRYHRGSILRRLVPGMPWLFINGEPASQEWVGKNCPFSWATMLIEIRSKGAVSWEGPGGFFEFEIRLDNLEEAAQFVKDNRGRKEQEAREQRREEVQARATERRQARLLLAQKNKETYERKIKPKAKPAPRNQEQINQYAREWRARKREEAGKPQRFYLKSRVRVEPFQPGDPRGPRSRFLYQGSLLTGVELAQVLGVSRGDLKNYWTRGRLFVDGVYFPRVFP